MKGLSGTVFTYGQPGSGKTHVSLLFIYSVTKN